MPRYELSEGGVTGAHKFWEITLTGPAYTVRWGRIGTRGAFAPPSRAGRGAAAGHPAARRDDGDRYDEIEE